VELLGDGQLVHTLEELIAALDRRLPHLEREGEAAIAQDAAKLRVSAVTRLAELTAAAAGTKTPESGH
jgi:hypothetical protein